MCLHVIVRNSLCTLLTAQNFHLVYKSWKDIREYVDMYRPCIERQFIKVLLSHRVRWIPLMMYLVMLNLDSDWGCLEDSRVGEEIKNKKHLQKITRKSSRQKWIKEIEWCLVPEGDVLWSVWLSLLHGLVVFDWPLKNSSPSRFLDQIFLISCHHVQRPLNYDEAGPYVGLISWSQIQTKSFGKLAIWTTWSVLVVYLVFMAVCCLMWIRHASSNIMKAREKIWLLWNSS